MENSRENRRVVFFSKQDLASGYHLQNAELVLRNEEIFQTSDINDCLEFYNIKLYFENDMFLLSWSNETKEKFKSIIAEAWKEIVKEYNSISSQNILEKIATLERSYWKSFWELISNLNVYKQIDNSIFSQILNQNPFHIRIILTHQKLVNQFSNEISDFLMGFSQSAELLLANFEQEHTSDVPKLFFPRSLSIKDRHEIISEYIERDNTNLNYIRLAENSISPELKLTNKLKLKAKKRSKELNDRILEEGHSLKFGMQVSISLEQEEPVIYSHEDDILNVTYSRKVLESLKSNVELFRVFDLLFLFTGNSGLISLVNKPVEMDVMEKLFMKSRNEYHTGLAFQRKSYLSQLQIIMFHHYLIQRGISLEKVIESFVEEVLNKLLNSESFQFRFPTPNSTFLEKIRVLAPEFEFLLKQYQVYVEEGEIDFELLKISSTPLRFSEIPSLNKKKYIYTDNGTIQNLLYHFFSDQSSIFYIESVNGSYDNFYDLIKNEKVTLEMFKDYQKDILNYLIEEKHLVLDKNGFINFKNIVFIHVIKELNENEVINYWHFPEIMRHEIDKMLESKMLYSENKLFSKPEIDYLNFHLNKKQFTNGLDLRNKYLHGTNASSENEHKQEYFILLKMLILAILKIENDLAIGK